MNLSLNNPRLIRGENFINGRWCAAGNGSRFAVLNPADDSLITQVPDSSAADAQAAVDAAQAAFAAWRATPAKARAQLLKRWNDLILSHQEDLGRLISMEQGKPLAEGRGEVAYAASYVEWFAEEATRADGSVIPAPVSGRRMLALKEPVGVVAAITPWNFPAAMIARKIAPALAAGCTVVAKPAEQTPFTALMLALLCAQAGVPPGVLNVVTGTGRDAGAPLVAHPGVQHISFTGSVATGVGVMQAAAPQVTRLVLELGGKSPIVVLADADLEAALENVLGAIFENAGQICSAGSRLVIDRRIHAAFVERLVARAAAITPGHGLRNTGMGAINSAAHLARVAGFVDRARARGVAVRTGGQATTDSLTGQGWFYRPTVLDDVPADDEAVQQEIFGPVLCVQPFDDLDHAVALANGTDYALVAGVFTRDFSAAHRLAQRIDAGQVFINEYFAGGIAVPFGGNRRSGFGREKGLEALRSYSKVKSVAARI